jgi:hypothetical protein
MTIRTGVGHVHAHFDHRGGHQHAHVARGEKRHHGGLFSAFMRECSRPTITPGQGGASFMRGVALVQVQVFAFFHQRAHPVHLSAFGRSCVADALNDFVAFAVGTTLVTMGVRPGGSSSMVLTSRSAK